MTAAILEFRPRTTTPEPGDTAAAMLAALPPDLAARYVLDGGCLRWTGPTNGRQGYGIVIDRFTTPDGRRVQAAQMAHRVAYEAVRGPIPDGLVLDHFRVGTRAPCIGPGCGFHTVPATVRVNSLRDGSASLSALNVRKTACSTAGHPYSEENTYRRPGAGWRECRTCRANRRHPSTVPDQLAA